MGMVSTTVRLRPVTKDEAQDALDAMDEIYDQYDIPGDTRQTLWEHFQTFASEVLIRFGEFDPEIGHAERNGH